VVTGLGPYSLNSVDNLREPSTSQLLRDLKFIDIHGTMGSNTRQALALGRLGVAHYSTDQVTQSHWVIFLDQHKLLWALYPDKLDVSNFGNGKKTYNDRIDNVFGAFGRNAVLLGPLSNLLL
jgi:hypothetical protein